MEKNEKQESAPQGQKESKTDHATLQGEKQQQLGKRLQQAREKRAMSLAEVSEQLRIRETYLVSLEEGEWSDLPEETYVRGFLRQYAGLLKLDISEELEALKPDEFHLTKPFTMPDPPIAPSRKWTIAVAAVFVLLAILFNVVRDTHHREAVVPQAPPPAPLKKPASQQPGAAKPATTTATPSPLAPKQATKEAAAPASPPPEKAAKTSPVKAPAPAAGTHRFRFTAVGENAWIQVFDGQHALLKEALLKPGDSLSLSYGDKPLFVTCGNSAALEIHADDKLIATAGSLGKSGKVLRDYKLVLPATPK